MEISKDFVATTAQPSATRIVDRIEAALFQQMLKFSGLENPGKTAEGGIGEEQFASFLTEEYAQILASRIDLRLKGVAER